MGNKEDIITAWFAEQCRADEGRFPIGIGDDMAMVDLGSGKRVLITTDMLLDGTHFDLCEISLEQAGFKAMNVSLSDCAAMATVPLCAVGASALPKGFDGERLKELHRGVTRAGDAFGCPLIGGDITSWASEDGRFAINITMLSVPAEGVEPVRRNGAKVGDIICVTGPLGGAIRGRHLDFRPRVKEAIELARGMRITAMIDISDGLSTDLNRICTQSGTGAVIEADKIPISEAAKEGGDPLSAALNDGEDFELLFTVGAEEIKKQVTVPVFEIGRIVEKGRYELQLPDGSCERIEVKGYDHL